MNKDKDTTITIPELEKFYEQLRLFSEEERAEKSTAWLPVASGTPDSDAKKPRRGRTR